MGERSKKSWIVVSMILLIILAALATYSNHGSSVLALEWVPYVPPSDIVTLYHMAVNNVSYVDVEIAFPHPLFNITNWGVPSIIGGNITVDAEIWEYTGPVPPLVTIVEHTYELGELPPGEYNFTFMVWENPVKSLTFTITHDIAITNIWPKKNIVGQGFLAFIMVNVTNEGDFTEIFNLTAYYNGTPVFIERWLDPDGSLSDAFWRFGDANRDGYVDYYDLYLVNLYFGWTGPPGENPADVYTDGIVNIWDVLWINGHFNLTIWDEFGISPIIQDFAVVRLNTTGFKIIGFRWNTTGFAKGNYTISAYAWPVLGETDISDNTFIDGTVYIRVPADLQPDGSCDMADITIMINYFMTTPVTGWESSIDVNDDLSVDMADITIAINNFMQSDP